MLMMFFFTFHNFIMSENDTFKLGFLIQYIQGFQDIDSPGSVKK